MFLQIIFIMIIQMGCNFFVKKDLGIIMKTYFIHFGYIYFYTTTSGRFPTFPRNKIGAGHFCIKKSAQVRIRAGQNPRRSKSAQKKNEPTLLYSALIKKKFVCEVNSFAFNDNSLHWEHGCIFCAAITYLSITITSNLSVLQSVTYLINQYYFL